MKQAKDFLDIKNEREAVIAAAPATPLPKTDKTRQLAEALHPAVQHLVVRQIIEYKDAKSFVLAADASAGTKKIAPYRAGQYLSLQLQIGDAVLTRPISISSGPMEAVKNNAYTITIKRAKKGFASAYLLDHLAVGDRLDASAPCGHFYYEKVRDAKHVIALAGGSGITPFRAMASAIADGYDDYDLTIIYGSRTKEDILFYDDFAEFEKRSKKVHVVHVLSDEKRDGFAHGFLTSDLIQRYLPKKTGIFGGGKERPVSFFVCGPKGLYDYIGSQLESFHLEKKWIRYELFGAQMNPATQEDYPLAAADATYQVQVLRRDEVQTIPARADETLLIALERAGIKAPSRCRSGECGFCRSRLITGEVYIPEQVDGRRLADKHFGYIHPCCSYPLENLTIEIY